MTIEELIIEYRKLGNYKTKDLDNLNKRLIKEKVDVSFLKDKVIGEDEFHRTYFQVSMGQLKTTEEKLDFIYENRLALNDWWHVDQLTQFVKNLDLDDVYKRAKEYVKHPHAHLRRWGYVIFMPGLVKDKRSFDMIVSLLKDDPHYHVIMAEAWLISYLAIYHPDRTFEYLNNCDLSYSIVGKAIQKICDSFRVDDRTKERFKSIRSKYKSK